jgi:GntR family transcriptional regulator
LILKITFAGGLMLQFHIQSDSDIPASQQLFDRIRFAIASRQYPPGHRLPSTRQLATITGLHRNTISKVYRQLEQAGLVESHAGSGIYVKAQNDEGESLFASTYAEIPKLVKKSLDELLAKGCSLTQAKELFLAEIDWRLRCSARVLVTVPQEDIGVGELMIAELEEALEIPIQLVPLEELERVLEQTSSVTVITNRYFTKDTEIIVNKANERLVNPNQSVRMIPVDIYDYAKELETIAKLPKDSCVGIVSLSKGILRAAEILIHSLRGDEILVLTAQVRDNFKLNALVRSASKIISDRVSYPLVKQTLISVREDLIRYPELIESDNYIGITSIHLLKRELGLD